jgi:integrase
VALPRERAKAPYAPRELASYLALADAQPTPLRRARAGALICLGAGAGLIGGELRTVRGTDVVCRSGGVLVGVGGRRARTVPVLAPFHNHLLAAAEFFGARTLVSGTNPDSHNVTNPLLRSLSGGLDLPRLETSRLRSSYLVAMAEAIGLAAFMEAAGVTCTQRLGDLVAHLDPPDEATAVARLGGRGQ